MLRCAMLLQKGQQSEITAGGRCCRRQAGHQRKRPLLLKRLMLPVLLLPL